MEFLIFFVISLVYILILITSVYFAYRTGLRAIPLDREIPELVKEAEKQEPVQTRPPTEEEIKADEQAQELALQAMAMLGFRGLKEKVDE